ncbi:MAG: MgtC/SapB family protein [Alistipes senegalensis]
MGYGDEWDLIVRLCVAGLCGTVIGLDREYRVKDAGFRTHFLVALGSALMMIVSQYGFEGFLATRTRTGSARPQPHRGAVVSGIGFIGAGTIIIHRQLVRGLTTAASLWATAGIGLAAGGHMCMSSPGRPPC